MEACGTAQEAEDSGAFSLSSEYTLFPQFLPRGYHLCSYFRWLFNLNTTLALRHATVFVVVDAPFILYLKYLKFIYILDVKLWQNTRNIKVAILSIFSWFSLVVLRTFMLLCKHRHDASQNSLHLAELKLNPLNNSHFPLCPGYHPSFCLCEYSEQSDSKTSCKWDHTVFTFL